MATPSVELLGKFSKAADGLVKIVDARARVARRDRADRRGGRRQMIVGAIGHTDADYDQARAAIHAGARHAVHMYNAMRPFEHRDPGVVGAILTDPEVTAEVIADLVHVAGAGDSSADRDEGIRHDSSGERWHRGHRHAGRQLPAGKFRGDRQGRRRRNAEGKLAGSTLTLDRALRNVVALGVPLQDAVRMATVLPARRLGLAGKKGIIAVGADADFVALTADLRIAGVMTRGVGLVANRSAA